MSGMLNDAEWTDILATLPENPETADGWELSLVRRTVERILAARASDGLADKVRALADEWHERAKARSDAWTPLYQDHAAALRALLPADTQDADQ